MAGRWRREGVGRRRRGCLGRRSYAVAAAAAAELPDASQGLIAADTRLILMCKIGRAHV